MLSVHRFKAKIKEAFVPLFVLDPQHAQPKHIPEDWAEENYNSDLAELTHPRLAPGGRLTDVKDYPSGKTAYALRSVDA